MVEVFTPDGDIHRYVRASWRVDGGGLDVLVDGAVVASYTIGGWRGVRLAEAAYN